MALQIGKDLSIGVQALYWRIDTITISPRHNSARVNFGGYIDAAAAAAGKKPAVRMEIDVPYSEFSALPAYDNLMRQVYRYIKTQPDWAAAVDV